MKNVQIPFELFIALVAYHMGNDLEREQEIVDGLSRKLDAMVLREWYSQYKSAPTEEAREKARQAYLDQRGILPGFRW